MKKFVSLLMLLVMITLTLAGCNTHTESLPAGESVLSEQKTADDYFEEYLIPFDSAVVAELYHRFFDLSEATKAYLRERGYSDAQIAGIDTVTYN